jgi:superoxide reductase
MNVIHENNIIERCEKMSNIGELFKTADWKLEKHVPVIEIVGEAKTDADINVNVKVGKEIAHPNTTEHHIAWMELMFHPEGGKVPYVLGRYDIAAHGASGDGPNKSTIYAQPDITAVFKTDKTGKLIAVSYCNIHGLWQGELVLGL